MVMESRPGQCPRCGTEIAFELQYETTPDGTVVYKDCSCGELISCASYDENQCPWIWYNYFCEQFGIQAVSPEEAAAWAAEDAAAQGEGAAQPEGGAPAEGEAPPVEGEQPPPEDQPPAQ